MADRWATRHAGNRILASRRIRPFMSRHLPRSRRLPSSSGCARQ
jgi:hypothetical protein